LKLPPIGSYISTSFIDWPGHVVAVIFTKGCNWRCPFCHNGPLALGIAEELDVGAILDDIARRASFLDGVVVSGGEPTIHGSLPSLLRRIKGAGLAVKLDTNGSNPSAIGELLNEGLIDAVAMDIKGPWDKYERLAGVTVDVELVKRSVELLKNSSVEVEFRTTYVPHLMDEEDLHMVRCQVEPGRWVIQLVDTRLALDPALVGTASPERARVAEAFPDVPIRG